MIRILIVEDNTIVRKGLAQLLEREPDMEVAGLAENGPAALALLNNQLPVDVILADFNMPEMDGVELTRRIREMNSTAKVIILTMHRQIHFREQAFAAGANGYLLKGEDEQELFTGICAVHRGKTFISRDFID